MQMQHDFLADLQAKLENDARVLAAWLEGSFGRGSADRYSDIDLHLLLREAGAFHSDARAWLEVLRPLVLYKLLFDGRMINALTDAGLRIDIWLHEEAPVLDPAKVKVLLDRDGLLRLDASPTPAPDTAKIAADLLAQIEEFWRCIALLPTVIGRNELLVSFTGLNVELGLVTEILMTGYGRPRDRGVKVLNAYLGDARRDELEAALDLHGLNAESLVMAHMALAGVIRKHGPLLAARHGFAYPTTLEEAVLRYGEQELHAIAWERPPFFAEHGEGN
ncbi:nucleotidyltransferase domain-containing protein [Caldilinea sp.]|uniref:nucleotidyltransferase domain-containing protein n=1 Tax=Caldilinea sp. TaxID=2293560 RepID=UPI002B836672|nr:nucleotidyltransferase domain-containing protein [Anaerolineales bacterium]HQY91369.1 nucleotidyltransferase domain-containing protein [Caldilinea sp.]